MTSEEQPEVNSKDTDSPEAQAPTGSLFDSEGPEWEKLLAEKRAEVDAQYPHKPEWYRAQLAETEAILAVADILEAEEAQTAK